MAVYKETDPYTPTWHLNNTQRSNFGRHRDIHAVVRQQGRPAVVVPRGTLKPGLINAWVEQDQVLRDLNQHFGLQIQTTLGLETAITIVMNVPDKPKVQELANAITAAQPPTPAEVAAVTAADAVPAAGPLNAGPSTAGPPIAGPPAPVASASGQGGSANVAGASGSGGNDDQEGNDDGQDDSDEENDDDDGQVGTGAAGHDDEAEYEDVAGPSRSTRSKGKQPVRDTPDRGTASRSNRRTRQSRTDEVEEEQSNSDNEDDDAVLAAQLVTNQSLTVTDMEADLVRWGFALEPRFSTETQVRFYWKAARIWKKKQEEGSAANPGDGDNDDDDESDGGGDEGPKDNTQKTPSPPPDAPTPQTPGSSSSRTPKDKGKGKKRAASQQDELSPSPKRKRTTRAAAKASKRPDARPIKEAIAKGKQAAGAFKKGAGASSKASQASRDTFQEPDEFGMEGLSMMARKRIAAAQADAAADTQLKANKSASGTYISDINKKERAGSVTGWKTTAQAGSSSTGIQASRPEASPLNVRFDEEEGEYRDILESAPPAGSGRGHIRFEDTGESSTGAAQGSSAKTQLERGIPTPTIRREETAEDNNFGIGSYTEPGEVAEEDDRDMRDA